MSVLSIFTPLAGTRRTTVAQPNVKKSLEAIAEFLNGTFATQLAKLGVKGLVHSDFSLYDEISEKGGLGVKEAAEGEASPFPNESITSGKLSITNQTKLPEGTEYQLLGAKTKAEMEAGVEFSATHNVFVIFDTGTVSMKAEVNLKTIVPLGNVEKKVCCFVPRGRLLKADQAISGFAYLIL